MNEAIITILGSVVVTIILFAIAAGEES